MSGVVLSNVSRAYGRASALRGVSLDAAEGKVLALLGPSGSGKSTILRLIAGLEPVDEGEIRIGNEALSSPAYTAAPETRRIGMVFQDYALFPHLSAGENVAFGLDKLSRADRDAEALRWLDRVGLRARAEAFPHELSGGEQQRIALARALAPKPRAVLLDEPFSGLDAILRAELRDATLAALSEARVTTLFVTHDAEDALQIADSIAILKQGRVLQQAAPREVYDNPTSRDAAAALGPVNTFAGRVANGALATPFGAIPVSGMADGAPAVAVVRIEHVQVSPGGPVRVHDVRPHGAHDLVRLEAGGVIWNALAPASGALAETVSATLGPRGVFVFPAGG
jgi:iron(III) transport system ATP-binding protein